MVATAGSIKDKVGKGKDNEDVTEDGSNIGGKGGYMQGKGKALALVTKDGFCESSDKEDCCEIIMVK